MQKQGKNLVSDKHRMLESAHEIAQVKSKDAANRGNRYSKKSRAAQSTNANTSEFEGNIHVPRKFAKKHVRGLSFNSTGKVFNDREEHSVGTTGYRNRPQVNSLVYDKATLEAEKE